MPDRELSGAFYSAAIGGSVEMLQFVLAEGYHWDAMVSDFARVHGPGQGNKDHDKDALDWLLENGCPDCTCGECTVR